MKVSKLFQFFPVSPLKGLVICVYSYLNFDSNLPGANELTQLGGVTQHSAIMGSGDGLPLVRHQTIV